MRDPYELYQGESRKWLLPVREVITGDFVDLTNVKLYMSIKLNISDVITLILKRNVNAGGDDSQIHALTPQNGVNKGYAYVYSIPTDSSALSPGSYYMDAWAILSTGEHLPIITSRSFRIKASVTTVF